ncbi:MAG: sterol desaturase family protein [Elusimicrobia bacterium]|nr:sterol desaturase family protein [Elusimicrobiota bacterium]
MFLGLETGAWRLIFSVGGLIGFGCWEQLRPFRKLVVPAPKHYLTNLLLGGFNVLVLNIGVSSMIVAYFDYLGSRKIGLLNASNLPPWANIALSFVFLDFITYLWHRSYHEIPLMWRLHKVHHSDLDLDVTSASRFHLGEILLSSTFKMFIGFIWGPSAIAIAIHEAGLLLAAQFQHANIHIPEPWETRLRRVFVTPDMHRIHHSNIPGETNSNYSNLFSFWDRLLGTYLWRGDQKNIAIGLKEYPRPQDITLPKLLAMPFIRSLAAQ